MVLFLIVLLAALVFEYINGFHDTANAIATVVSTRVLSPRSAILMATTLNFCGALVSVKVAKTISSGLVDPHSATQTVVLAAIIGAIVWNLITWRFVIAIVLMSKDRAPPVWVIIGCAGAMAFGTAAGGWRIIKTMGHRIVRLEPVHGFAAETTAATVLFVTAHYGMPVSTTHTIAGSI